MNFYYTLRIPLVVAYYIPSAEGLSWASVFVRIARLWSLTIALKARRLDLPETHLGRPGSPSLPPSLIPFLSPSLSLSP